MKRGLRSWAHGLSLRARLVIGIVCLLALGLAVADVAGIVLIRAFQLQRIDQQLTIIPGTSARSWSIGSRQLCSALTAADTAPQLPTRYTLAALDASGHVLCRLPQQATALGSPDFSRVVPQLSAAVASQKPVTVRNDGHGAPWRLRVVATSDGYAVVGISLEDAIVTLARLQLIMTLVSTGILLLAGVGGWLVVRIGLRPLTAIEQTADAIAKGDLTQRVAVAPTSTEVGRLAASLNTMLGQIEQGFDEKVRTEDRLRQFLADASHELRTPLATVRGHAELYRQGVATAPADVAMIMGRIEAESIRMGDLVNDLLLLARLDTAPGLSSAPVDLLTVATDAVVDARARDPHRPVTLSQPTEAPWLDDAPVIIGDEARVRQVLGNLISNVLRHTPPGSAYEVVVGHRTELVRVEIIDHGPGLNGLGLNGSGAERVFERFYRGDFGRARSVGGAGLGLSIVKSLMAAHGGSVSYVPTPGGGATFVLSFPSHAGSTEAEA